jgi:hypothetical protein
MHPRKGKGMSLSMNSVAKTLADSQATDTRRFFCRSSG